MKLKDVALRNLKPVAKPKKLFDGGGLYLLVSPKGSKCWRLKYRYGGKEKCLALGIYPEVGLKEVRIRRDEMRKLLAEGIDPSVHRQLVKVQQTEQQANSFKLITLEWMEKRKAQWTNKYYLNMMSRLERNIFPALGRTPVNEVTAPKLLATLRRIEAKGNVYTARQLLNFCSQIFRYAIATSRAERNVAEDLRGALPPAPHKHFAAITEPKEVANLLRAMDAYEGGIVVGAALRLAPLVFVRPGELRKALWADINFETAEWRYLVTKTNTEHVVPLSIQAVSILKSLYPITCHSKYIFPSARTATRPMSDNAVLAALRRMEIPKDQMTGHGFRAMARTILDEVLGVRPDFIEHQLAHSVRDPNGRAYNRTAFLSERKKMMQQWADYLGALKAGEDYCVA